MLTYSSCMSNHLPFLDILICHPSLEEGSMPGLAIKSVPNVNYLVDLEDQPESKHSWILLSDIPTAYSKHIEQFH